MGRVCRLHRFPAVLLASGQCRGERLWSDKSVTDIADVSGGLHNMRCRMIRSAFYTFSYVILL